MTETEAGQYETIPEITVTVIKNPTNLWILNDDLEPEELRAYEQWEQNRQFIAKAIYHHPSGAKFYMKNIDDPFGIADEDTDLFEPPLLDPNTKPAVTESLYTWVKNDTIWLVATRLNIPARDLMEHNDIEDPGNIQPGTVLHLPIPKSGKPARISRFELLPKPLQMHVAKEGGTRKWSFGNAKTWEEITVTGFYPHRTNVTILAVAYVPITEKDGTEVEAAYYLDAMSLGDFKTTARVRYTTGYNWIDLEAGHVDKNDPPKAVEAVSALPPAELEEKKIEFQEMIAEEASENPDKYPNFFKTTWQKLDPPVACTTVLPNQLDFIWIEDQDGKRPPRKLHQSQELVIAGTFEKGNVLYGRPIKSAENDYWYGINMDYLISEEELYNTQVDQPTRVALGTLTWSERYITVPVAKTITHPLIQRFLNKNNKKER